VKSKEVKTGWSNLTANLAESCNEGFGSKMAVFQMMVI
jgi:hypothetical protein